MALCSSEFPVSHRVGGHSPDSALTIASPNEASGVDSADNSAGKIPQFNYRQSL
jgi:hypothetical protein